MQKNVFSFLQLQIPFFEMQISVIEMEISLTEIKTYTRDKPKHNYQVVAFA